MSNHNKCDHLDEDYVTLSEGIEYLNNLLVRTKEVLESSHLSSEKKLEQTTQLALMKSAFDSLDSKFQDFSKRVEVGNDFANESKIVVSEKRQRKIANYKAKVKCGLKFYTLLNSKLTVKLTALAKPVHSLPSQEEIDELQTKVKRYDIEIYNLEKKHPWLKTSIGDGNSMIIFEVKKMEIRRKQYAFIMDKLDEFAALEPLLH